MKPTAHTPTMLLLYSTGAALLWFPSAIRAFLTTPRIVGFPRHVSASSFFQLQAAATNATNNAAPKTEEDPWNKHDLGRKPSYSDHWLLDMHHALQDHYQLTTNALTPYNRHLEEEAAAAGIVEWQAAFQRNGFADFTPPMTTAGMQCLMIGADVDPRRRNPSQRNHFQTKLPWMEDDAEADVTSLRVVVHYRHADDEDDNKNNMIPSIQTQLVPSTTQSSSSSSTASSHASSSSSSATSSSSSLAVSKDTAAVYDCIMDQGLLESVIFDQPDQVQQLLREAAIALREHGIYVWTTSTPITASQQALLTSLTQDCGLEWQFALDGISDPTQQVSVARRFNAGAMPKVGRLSRYQPS